MGRSLTGPRLTLVDLGGEGPILLVGPSLGTDVRRLWSQVADELSDGWHIIGWNLPGHGESPPATGFTIADIANSLLGLVDGPFAYAGVSVGGAVGLELALTEPAQVLSLAVLCSGAKIGSREMWVSRAAQVDAYGTASMVAGSRERWFAPGFDGGTDLLAALPEIDNAGYAATCRALSTFDVRSRLGELKLPLLAVAGEFDQATPVSTLREITDVVDGSRLVVLNTSAHLPTVECPSEVAELLRDHLSSPGALQGQQA